MSKRKNNMGERIMIGITNMMSILIAGIVMGVFYFIMEYDWSYWIYVGIYTAIYTVGIFISVFIDISLMDSMMVELFFGELLGSYLLYIVLNIISYAIIGMAVVYILNSVKDSEKKLFVSVGVISQLVMTIFVQQLLGNIISI